MSSKRSHESGQANAVPLALAAIVVLAIGVAIGYGLNRSPVAGLDQTKRYAVALLNGQVYFGTPVRKGFELLWGGALRLNDVYYVQAQINPETRETRNILVKRGNEWHSPTEMIINPSHILLVEPVGAGSNVDDLIRKLEAQGPAPTQK